MLKRIKQNFSYLLASEFAVRTLTLIFTIYLARIYGPEKFGIYGLALSIGGLFEVIFNMGLTTIFIQRVAANPQAMHQQLRIFLPLRLLLSLGIVLSFIAFSFFLQKEAETMYSLFIAALYFSISSSTTFLWSCFDARQKMGYTALIKLLMYFVTIMVGIGFILQSAPMYTILSAYGIGAFIALMATIITIQKNFTPITLEWNPPEWKKIITAGWPIALSGTFVLVYTSLDTLLISIHKGEYFVGQYQMGYKIIGTLFILAIIINQAYFPSLIEQAKKSKDRFQKIFNANFATVFFWSIPLTIGGLMLADRIILFIFGSEYMAGAPAFKILIWNTIIFFTSSALINVLYAHKKQRAVMNIFFIGAFVNVILNILIIPTYGIEGAALTTIAAELMVLIGIYFQARKHIHIHIFSTLIKPCIAAAIMAGVLSIIFIESLILTIGIGALTYFGVYFAQRAWLFPDEILDSSHPPSRQHTLSENLPDENKN